MIIRPTDGELGAVGDGIEAATRCVGFVVVIEAAGGRVVKSKMSHGSRAAKKHHRGNDGNLHSEILTVSEGSGGMERCCGAKERSEGERARGTGRRMKIYAQICQNFKGQL